MSRMLGKLDALGIIQPVDRKGRVLTLAGQEAFISHRTQLRRGENFERALELRTSRQSSDDERVQRAPALCVIQCVSVLPRSERNVASAVSSAPPSFSSANCSTSCSSRRR